MLCRQTLFIVAAFLTMVAHSLPYMGLEVIRRYEAEGGNITSFNTVDLNHRQCDPPNQPKLTCSDNFMYTVYQLDCVGLQAVLSGQQRKGRVERVSNSVCYIVAGSQSSPQTKCCISTTMPIPNVVDEEYLNFVITLKNQCGGTSGLVAGLISYINTKSECNNVCLSNHYDECLWSVGHWK